MAKVIGIDASRAVRANRTGTEVYSWEIIRSLAKIDTINRYLLYAPHMPRERMVLPDNFEWRILPQRRLWSQVRLARELNDNPPDVLFVPSHVIPLLSRVPTVVTIHDLAYEFFPQAYPYWRRRYMRYSTGVSVGKAKKIIVPSESTKRDVMKEYKITGKKIEVIAHGYNSEIFHPDTGEGKPPLESPYILYVGRIEEKKNVKLLVEAFGLFAKEKKSIHLVLAGSLGFGHEKIQEAIKNLTPTINSRILLPGYLPEFDMVRYLRSAEIFAFPSFYEGFGLPVLEAMAVGTPTICSNSSSLPEVAGDGAMLLAPTNALAWAAAFSRIINQPALAKEQITRGLAQSKKFSWEKSARKTHQAIIDVAEA
jgi:glycosyltransferase involved in cell wall biosynthesis